MDNRDWYRKTNWTKRDKEDFFEHLKRSRKSGRVQFIKIQAYYLYETNRYNEISAALELNNLALSEKPENIFLAEIYEQKALCQNKLGKFDDAEENFLLAFQAMREFPNVKPNAPLTFGLFVIENKIKRLYKKAIEVLDEFDYLKSGIVFPVMEYYIYGIKAIIQNRDGDIESSKLLAQKAISASEKQYSGLSRHRNIGLVDETGNSFYNELVSIIN